MKHWRSALAVAVLVVLTAIAARTAILIEVWNARAGGVLPRDVSGPGNPKWRWLPWEHEDSWREVCRYEGERRPPVDRDDLDTPLTRKQSEWLLGLIATHDGPLSQSELDHLAELARSQDPITTAEDRDQLWRLIVWAPLTAEENADMMERRRHAKNRNRLRAIVGTWGLLQYVIAPLALILAVTGIAAAKRWTSKAAAIACGAVALACIVLMFSRGYLTSLGY